MTYKLFRCSALSIKHKLKSSCTVVFIDHIFKKLEPLENVAQEK